MDAPQMSEDLRSIAFNALAAISFAVILGFVFVLFIRAIIALRDLLPQRCIAATHAADSDGKVRIVDISHQTVPAYGCTEREVSAALRSFAMSLGDWPGGRGGALRVHRSADGSSITEEVS
jgi:hypothetical protein